jgi:hypothetical protein
VDSGVSGNVDTNPTVPNATDTAGQAKKAVCGIVMPIAAMGDEYPKVHWDRVRRILIKAIELAGMDSQLVWENTDSDVIQTSILTNIYENDVIVCDVSNLNPNVMLETGLRLSTKLPTIIVTDELIRPPFDISTIGYLAYQRDLEFNSIEQFIGELSNKIRSIHKAKLENRYRSFVENFKFETVEPTTVTVTTEQHLSAKIDKIISTVNRLENRQKHSADKPLPYGTTVVTTKGSVRVGVVSGRFDELMAKLAEEKINSIAGVFCTMRPINKDVYDYEIWILHSSGADPKGALMTAMEVIEEHEISALLG